MPLARRISNVSRAQPVPEDLHTIEALLKELRPALQRIDLTLCEIVYDSIAQEFKLVACDGKEFRRSLLGV